VWSEGGTVDFEQFKKHSKSVHRGLRNGTVTLADYENMACVRAEVGTAEDPRDFIAEMATLQFLDSRLNLPLSRRPLPWVS
jgi:hypothetical protein